MKGQGTTTIAPNRCMICEEINAAQTPQCLSCAAPMALVHDSIAQDREPQIVSVIGDTNVGKTVYLGFLLDMLTHRAGDFEAIPKGAYSIDLQQTVISNMSQRMFPPKTPMEANQWYWAYYQVYKHSPQPKWVDLIMPDIAGESLAAEVAAPNTFKVIRSLLNKSAGLMLLVDAALAANGSSQPDFFAVRMLSYIDTMYGAGRNQRIGTPTAILLCKADQCPDCFDDPRKFVKANMNRLWNLCESRLSNFEFFACSVVGSLGYATAPQEDYVIPVPLHTALQGILEPFQWVVDQL
ncbi:MAG TPA: hypothetical protein PLL20_05640 [Phycisphaerae bacterium]|nr:hypothetical protein [Phycisphaerae bacterium]HRR83557.1 hypothetical protein [Phycisphaerae bacterium]